jgi:SAM-dependent methyltransferase
VFPDFSPTSALDFGCGVGRLSVALAKRLDSIVGVDVSSGMLRKARLRCEQVGVKNLSLILGDDNLSQVEGKFDLVTSFIVLQHIPVNRGEQLFRRLVELLNDGGVAALHVTYSRADIGPDLLRAANVSGSPATSEEKPDPNVEPAMQMNGYDLNHLIHHLQISGIRRLHTELTDHGGSYGVMLFFRKVPNDPYAA